MKWIMFAASAISIAIAFYRNDDTAAIASVVLVCAGAVIGKIEELK